MGRIFGLLTWWVNIVKEPYVVYLAVRDPRVDRRTRIIAAAATVLLTLYIINPFDIIPDIFIIGLLDDLILVPLATYLIERSIPKPVLTDARRKARVLFGPVETVFTVIAVVLAIFIILIIAAVVFIIWRLVRG